MKKGFPHKILGVPYGWQSRGNVSGDYISDGVSSYYSHKFCKTRAKIGIDIIDGLFRYCPKCLIKLTD